MDKTLNAFLHPLQVENKKVVVSKRFIGDDGKPIAFEIRPIGEDENGKLIKKHTKRDKQGVEAFNRVAYVHELTAMAVIYPDLTNAELQNGYGVMGAENLLAKMLLIGEYADLSDAVMELSGIENDINDDIEEAKNSSGREMQN